MRGATADADSPAGFPSVLAVLWVEKPSRSAFAGRQVQGSRPGTSGGVQFEFERPVRNPVLSSSRAARPRAGLAEVDHPVGPASNN